MSELTRLCVLTVVLLLLAACGPRPDARVSYRDTGLSLYSNAAYNPARLTGDWVQVAGFQRPNAGNCGAGAVRFGAPAADGRIPLEARLCLSGREIRFRGFADQIASGRLVPSGADPRGIGQPWWILWADVDDRTLVIGTPSGDFGFILNREGKIPADRLTAARELLDFNRYDLTWLKVF